MRSNPLFLPLQKYSFLFTFQLLDFLGRATLKNTVYLHFENL